MDTKKDYWYVLLAGGVIIGAFWLHREINAKEEVKVEKPRLADRLRESQKREEITYYLVRQGDQTWETDKFDNRSGYEVTFKINVGTRKNPSWRKVIVRGSFSIEEKRGYTYEDIEESLPPLSKERRKEYEARKEKYRRDRTIEISPPNHFYIESQKRGP